MRFFFLLIILSFSVKAQIKRVELQIKTDDKISVHGFSYWKELKIKSADTSFSYSLHTKNPDIIPNLKTGNYSVTAISVFNTQIHKKINLQKKITLVKFTGLATTYHKVLDTFNLTEKIKLHDTLYIIYNTPRNEENNNVKLAITKNKDGFAALLYEGLTNTVFSIMQFNPDLYKHVVEFELSGKKANSQKAETTDNKEVYTIELNKETTSFIIPGTWGGLDKLRAILFIVQK
ncbi:MAG TPA: hypothetical protein VNX01_13080 [Bacteroidia bacterium]|jgi:hypothetical protein|nr:hypothetical protein [Bacteroidia bacterium]